MKRLIRISNAASGVVLGNYPGDTWEEAREAMARDAGYASAADMPGDSSDSRYATVYCTSATDYTRKRKLL